MRQKLDRSNLTHQEQLQKALLIIARAIPQLAADALNAHQRSGIRLQSQFNEIATAALTHESLSRSERDDLLGLIRFSEPDSYDAMLRCRMSKDQLKVELPAKARAAGFNDISKYVRWILFGTDMPDQDANEVQRQSKD